MSQPPDIEPASLVADAATRLHRAVMHTGTARLRDWNISLSSYAALRVIAARPDLTLAQLSRRCFVRPQTMTRMVRDLEARGWVLRSPKPGDDRAIAISLTQTGRSTLHDMDLEARRINTTIERALSADEIDLLNELLRRCTLEVESELRTSYPADAY